MAKTGQKAGHNRSQMRFSIACGAFNIELSIPPGLQGQKANPKFSKAFPAHVLKVSLTEGESVEWSVVMHRWERKAVKVPGIRIPAGIGVDHLQISMQGEDAIYHRRLA